MNGEEIVVEVLGVEVYDPTTGEVRSHDTGHIAVWMIDTDYNDGSFFVRHTATSRAATTRARASGGFSRQISTRMRGRRCTAQ